MFILSIFSLLCVCFVHAWYIQCITQFIWLLIDHHMKRRACYELTPLAYLKIAHGNSIFVMRIVCGEPELLCAPSSNRTTNITHLCRVNVQNNWKIFVMSSLNRVYRECSCSKQSERTTNICYVFLFANFIWADESAKTNPW